jgi:internalin A
MRFLKTILILISIVLAERVGAQTVYTLPDTNFKVCLADKYPYLLDANQDLIIQEAKNFIEPLSCISRNISSVEGLQYFTSVQEVFLNKNNISSISAFPTSTILKRMVLDENQLTQLPDLSVVPKLTTLVVNKNKLTSLPNLSVTPKLRQLYVSNNQLTTIPSLNKLADLWAFTFTNNLLTELPVLDSLKNLEELVAAGNKLTSVQSLVNLPKLIVVDLGNNQLTSLPVVLPNNVIKTVNIQNNKFTTLPDFTVFPKLTKADINNNNFTFSTLKPLESIVNYKTIFSTTAQKIIKVGTSHVLKINDILVLHTLADANVNGVQYNWYLNGTKVSQQTSDSFKLNTASDTLSGNYWLEMTYTNFPNLILKTDTFKITILPCLESSSFVLDIKPKTCINNNARIEISSSKNWPSNFEYELKDLTSDVILKSSNGVFNGLKGMKYSLSGNTQYCTSVISREIVIEEVNCEDGGFITADGDGFDDVYSINDTGSAIISDKFGNRVMELSLPAQWDALGKYGKVAPGLYYININQGEKLIKITVVH